MNKAEGETLASYERALVASEQRFRALIEMNADGIVVVDREGMIRFMNPAAERLFGRGTQESLGTPFGVPVVPNERTEIDVFRSGCANVVAEMRVTETDWEGSLAYLATLRDFSDRKRLEEELRSRADALAEADRRKDEFLATLAHELRNPLAPLRNALYLWRMADGDPKLVVQFQDMMERQVNHLVRLVDDLLEVSRITRGKIVLRKDRTDLRTVLHNAIETTKPMMSLANHQVDVEIPEEPVWLFADAVRLVQVFTNLLNNAAKYTNEGGRIEVRLTVDGDDAVVTVVDNGIGMESEVLSRVFDIFTQVDRWQRREPGGLGIGLTLVRALVQLHGGTVQALSDGLDQGSTLVVRLPRMRDDEPTIVRIGETSQTNGVVKPLASSREHPLTLHTCRILVVDDNRDSADSAAMLLRCFGAMTKVCYDGRSALAAAEVFRPHAMLLDIGMPGMSGHEVAIVARNHASLKGMRLIAMTGWGQEADRRRSRESGFDFHLVKPLDQESIAAALEGLCEFAEPRKDIADGEAPDE